MRVLLRYRAALACALPFLLAGGSVSVPSGAPLQPDAFRLPAAVQQARVLDQYAQLPLCFEPNLGQTSAQVRFLARAGGYTMFLTAGEAVMVLSRSERREKGSPRRHEPAPVVQQAVVRMRMEGGAANAPVVGLERQPGISAYFIGNDPAKWRPEVPRYSRVEYKRVYPGVDLVYYGDQRQVEYDFEVAPGADPGQIRLAYEGAELRVDQSGDLVLATRLGELRQRRPQVWQQVGARRVEVAASYRLLGKRVGVEVASYDRNRALVIDPVLVYSTYLGGNSYDYPGAIVVDTAGAAYVAGYTTSTDFPTANAYQANSGGGTYTGADAFVTKLNAYNGSGPVTLAYSTYLGGSGDDMGGAIAVDAAGAVYVAGSTTSTNFPTPNAYQSSFGGGPYTGDAFVTKLKPYSGSGPVALAYSTYLGGSGEDAAHAIAVDAAGAAYVVGETGSRNFPTLNAYQSSFGGGAYMGDAFVTKLNAYGGSGRVTLAYSTYLGGYNDETAIAVAVDAAGAAYVAGYTYSTDFPTANAYQTALRGTTDAFVTKLNANGGSSPVTLAYSTYLGGSKYDYAWAIAVDAAGAAYVAGSTDSTDFPTANPYQAHYGGAGGLFLYDGDAFVAKLKPYNGGGPVALAYSTYLGGSATDLAYAIAVDSTGAAYIAGVTASTDFPKVNAYQTSLHGTRNAFVAELNAYGGSGAVTLAFSTYLGGGSEVSCGVAVDSAGAVYVAGYAYSNFPTVNPYQAYGGGLTDGFVTKIAFGPSFTAAGVANVGSYLSGAVAPGEIVSIFGSNLGPSVGVPNTGYDPATGALPTALGNVSVSFDGQAAPLFFVRNDQINVQVPYEVAGKSATGIVVTYNGAPSAAVSVPVTAVSPGIFQYNGRTLVLNAVTGAIVDGGNPASRGDYVILFGTGPGLVDPPVPTGKPATASPYSLVRNPQAQIGGRVVPVAFAGMTPGFTGLMQINLQVPADAPTGSDVPLQLSVNGMTAQAYLGGAPTAALTIAIK